MPIRRRPHHGVGAGAPALRDPRADSLALAFRAVHATMRDMLGLSRGRAHPSATLGRTAALAAFCASTLVALRVDASPSARLVYVRDAAAGACPEEPELRRAVQKRVGYDPFFPWAKTTVVVEVAGDGPTFVARVLLVDDKGRSRGVRELRSGATGCKGLVDAAALAISIALDMNALEPGELKPVSAPPDGALPAASPATTSPSDAATPSPADAPSLSGATRADRASPDAAYASRIPVAPLVVQVGTTPSTTTSADAIRPSPAAKLRGALGIDALAAMGSSPDVVAGVDVWAAARRGIGSLGLELRVDAPSTTQFANGGRASILLAAATLDGCVRFGPVFVCTFGTAGWLHGAGSDVAAPHSGAAVFLALGPRAGVEVPLSRSVALRVRGELLVDALRPSVVIDTQRWSLPPLGGDVASGLAYLFP